MFNQTGLVDYTRHTEARLLNAYTCPQTGLVDDSISVRMVEQRGLSESIKTKSSKGFAIRQTYSSISATTSKQKTLPLILKTKPLQLMMHDIPMMEQLSQILTRKIDYNVQELSVMNFSFNGNLVKKATAKY